MDLAHVTYAVDGGIATITVNRPDKMNALNEAVMADIDAAFAHAKGDGACRAVILTGAGEKAFVAGADIGELATQTVRGGKAKSLRGQAVLSRIEQLGKPVVAMLNGYAFGGGLELALACHMRTMAAETKIGLPEVGLAIIPGYGGTQRLPRLIGLGRAYEMILSGAPIDAVQAERYGLVNAVAPAETLRARTEQLLKPMLRNGPVAMGMAMESMQRGLSSTLEEGLRIECDLFGIVSSTKDMREGLNAFLEKRKPTYEGA